jgi:hypothetical protein
VKGAWAVVDILNEKDFNDEFSTYKQGILADQSLSDSQRDEQFALLTKYRYADNLYGVPCNHLEFACARTFPRLQIHLE